MSTTTEAATVDASDTDRIVLPGEHRQVVELDGVRGLAIMMVLCCHLLLFPGGLWGKVMHEGWVGVDLFFVLSGFLITSLLFARRGRPRYFRGFYRRRALRILPPYLALVLVTWAAGQFTTRSLLASLLFLGNFITTPIPVIWSVCVEEHFYLLWPTLAYLLRPRGLLVASLGVCALAAILRYAFPSPDVYVYTWSRIDALAMGAALACVALLCQGRRRALRAFAAGALALAGGIALILLALGSASRNTRLGGSLQLTAVDLGCAAFLAFTLAQQGRRFATPFRSAPLRYFGRISYSLYLYHESVYGLFIRWAERLGFSHERALGVAAVAGLVVSIGLAKLSFEHFESWFLRRKEPMPTMQPVLVRGSAPLG